MHHSHFRRSRARRWFWVLGLALGVFSWLGGVPQAEAEPRSSRIPTLVPELRVAVVTFGPGDHPFARFGHDAIWIALPDGRGAIYNFGTFGGETSSLITKFLQGRFKYWLSLSPPEATLRAYESYDRTILVQDLALTSAEKRELWRRLEINSQLENREYLYDYFKDNCSTRVRDALDGVLGGALKKSLVAQPARLNFRQHALRLAADLPWLYVGLHFGLAQDADSARSRWEEGFIPEGVSDMLADFQLQRGGRKAPLVEKSVTTFRAQRAPAASIPPTTWPWFLGAGLGLSSVLFALAMLARGSKLARVTLGALIALLGLVCGLLGLILVFFWAFTNHQIAFRNENIALCPPWLLALVVSGVGVAWGNQKLTRFTHRVLGATLGLGVLAVLLKVTPWFFQSNVEFVVFFLPVWAALWVGSQRLTSRGV